MGSKYERGDHLWQDYGTAGDADCYTIEAVRSDKKPDEHGRTHWRMEVNGAQWTYFFYAWLIPGSHPLDSAHRYFAGAFGAEIEAAKTWSQKQAENARQVLAHAKRNVVKLGDRGAVQFEVLLIAIGLGIVAAVRLAVEVWG